VVTKQPIGEASSRFGCVTLACELEPRMEGLAFPTTEWIAMVRAATFGEAHD